MAEQKRWAGTSRAAQKASLNLGIVLNTDEKSTKFRRKDLEFYDSYYECTQYDSLIPWDSAAARACEDGDYIGVRKRQPRINFAFAKVLASRLTSKICGRSTFPKIVIEEDPMTTEFIQELLDWVNFKADILEPIRRCINTGSVFIRFSIQNGVMNMEHYLSKYCYPEFDEAGRLMFVKIQYVYCDYADLDVNGKPKEKWYRMDLGTSVDTSYDNPEYKMNAEPSFEVVESVTHDLGFVQGTWFRTSKDRHKPDGYALVEDVTDFIDELNYSLSQSSQAVSYNQEPQLTISGMDNDELDHIIRSSSKAINLGREGKASFLETNMGGVQVAQELRDSVKTGIQDIARVVMLDPDKIVGSAQSGKAMEVLHGPMVELVDELRPVFEKQFKELITKMALTVLILSDRGVELEFQMPEGWKPQGLDLVFRWPPIFPMTIEDLQKKVSLASSVAGASILSREAMTRWLAQDFDIEDIEAELQKVASQPVINPFGGF